MVEDQTADMRIDALDLLMLNLDDIADFNHPPHEVFKEQLCQSSGDVHNVQVSEMPPVEIMCVEDSFGQTVEPIFQFDLQQLPLACNQFHTPSATPNNTPHTTPSITPESSNPGSPRGYGSSTPHSRGSPAAKVKPADTQHKQKLPRHKRESHINAEYRRRGKIQRGFEEIRHLVPTIQESKQGKDSKSAMLGKTVDYCRQIRAENKELDLEAAQLREEIEALTCQIKSYQNQLPVSGISCKQSSTPVQIEKCYENYVRSQSSKNWKFWIFSLIIHPLFNSYNQSVSTANLHEFCNTVMTWAKEHCSLAHTLRPAVFNTMRQLSTQTSILTSPKLVQAEAQQAAETFTCTSTLREDDS